MDRAVTDSEAMLHEANRRAHKVARAAQKWERISGVDGMLILRSRHPEAWEAAKELGAALTAYEEIEERQQKEATL